MEFDKNSDKCTELSGAVHQLQLNIKAGPRPVDKAKLIQMDEHFL